MIDKALLREMLAAIEARFPGGKSWAWTILELLPRNGVNLFSEYETYGHWLKHYHPEAFRALKRHWLRQGTEAAGFHPTPEKLHELAQDYDFAAFEARERLWKKLASPFLDLAQWLGVLR